MYNQCFTINIPIYMYGCIFCQVPTQAWSSTCGYSTVVCSWTSVTPPLTEPSGYTSSSNLSPWYIRHASSSCYLGPSVEVRNIHRFSFHIDGLISWCKTIWYLQCVSSAVQSPKSWVAQRTAQGGWLGGPYYLWVLRICCVRNDNKTLISLLCCLLSTITRAYIL